MPSSTSDTSLYKTAFALSIFTIVYNIGEGFISTYFGFENDTLALFGFGLDSFIEAVSAIGIAHMVIRIMRNAGSKQDKFEITALKITGYSFYSLCLVLAVMCVQKIMTHENPSTTFWGIIISSLSIVVMLGTIYWKTSLGKNLNSPALIADANCAKVCVYMSLVLLASSLLYHFFHIPYIDIAGTVGIIYFSFQEGKECFDKAKGIYCCEHDH
jgi:divalent metal cation (Fe/Co/Zn/Cd) transporter